MKAIDRSFAIRMLEIGFGKTESEIMEEAKNHSGDWPMGEDELERDLGAMQKLAQITLEYYRYRRPSMITLTDIKIIHGKVYKGSKPGEDRFYLERYRKRLFTVFEVYEGVDRK
jgi:hypothetical protein